MFSTVGYWINRGNSRFIIEHRPDFVVNGLFPNAKRLLSGWIHNHRTNNCGDLARFYMMYLNAKQILSDGVPGDFVELGVYKGNSAKLLADLCVPQQRILYLFDTFSGFDERDLKGVDSSKIPQFSDTSISAVKKLVGTTNVRYIKGFFPESIEGTDLPTSIAFAHIDCDLYQPMIAGLECFYPRLAPGAIMFLHDYSSGEWAGAKIAVDEFFRNRPEKPILMPDKSGTAVIRKAH